VIRRTGVDPTEFRNRDDRTVRAAVVQLTSTDDLAVNLAAARRTCARRRRAARR